MIFGTVRPVNAATIYSDLKDITIQTTFAGVYLDIDTGATSSAAFTGWDVNLFYGGVAIGNSAAFQPIRVGSSNLNAVVRHYEGMTLPTGLFFSSGIGGSGNPGHEHIGDGIQQFQVGAEGYLAFKFTPNGGSTPLNGWMRLKLTNNVGGALIRDWGYDDAGGAIVIGRVEQSEVDLFDAQTVTLSPPTGESFALGSAVTDTGGHVNSILKIGGGRTTLTSANSFTGATTINGLGGTLEAATAGALGQTGALVVSHGGTLLLSGTGNRVNDAAGLELGGTLATNGLSETLGTLTLLANSTIDFGSANAGNALVFSPSAGSWTNTLSVWNWSGTTAGNGADRFFVGADAAGLNASQLSQLSLFSGAGSGFLGTGAILGTGEIVPVPEPSGIVLAFGLVGLAGWREGGWARSKRRVGRS